jgi:hypothetical protein
MIIKVIEVQYRFWGKPKQTTIKYGEIDLPVVPIKGDKIIIDDVVYNVIQRDIVMRRDPENQRVTLFVEKVW